MMENKNDTGLYHADKHTNQEKSIAAELSRAFAESHLPVASRLQNFPLFTRRQDLSRFLTKWELFKKNLHVHGSVVECGVFAGGGLMSWLHFSTILEPFNHSRRIIGFDTFSGFPEIAPEDQGSIKSEHLKVGGLHPGEGMDQEITRLSQIHDRNRPIGHIEKVQLVKGDATKRIPEFVEANPHLLISLLYLDFDIFEPTQAALAQLFPRVAAGGIVAFDELNCPEFPGETLALLKSFDLTKVKLERLPYDPYISYFVKG